MICEHPTAMLFECNDGMYCRACWINLWAGEAPKYEPRPRSEILATYYAKPDADSTGKG